MSKTDVTTVLVSAGSSAVIAALVSVGINVLLGGWIEVRKVRAVRRFEVQRALGESLRMQLNVVRQLLDGQTSYSIQDGRVVRYDDGFTELFNEMESRYREVRMHYAGMDRIQPEGLLGAATLAAGIHVARVHDFRQQAVGKSSEALSAMYGPMRRDIETARELLVAALNYLHAPIRARWCRRTRLARRLKELDRLAQAGRTPATPENYVMALRRVQSTDGQHAPLPPSS